MTQSKINLYIFVIILLIGIYIYSIKPTIIEELNFNLNYMNDSYKRTGVVFDKMNKTLVKNGITYSYKNGINVRNSLCNNKVHAVKKLKQQFIPVATNYIWNNKISTAYNIYGIEKVISYPMVVKPTVGQQGYGVTVGIKNRKHLINCINEILESGKKPLIESHIQGDEYRIMIFKGEIVGITKRSKPKIIGNGISTIDSLITEFNDTRSSFKCHNVDYNLIQDQDYTRNDVLKKGQPIFISNVANLSNGGGIEDINISTVHPDNLTMFKKATKVCGLKLTGIDYITPSITTPYYSIPGKSAILELNSSPGMSVHYLAKSKKNRNGFIDNFISRFFY